MSTKSAMVALARKRLKEVEQELEQLAPLQAERDRLMALLRTYGVLPQEHTLATTMAAQAIGTLLGSKLAPPKKPAPRPAFDKKAGGPTDAIFQVLAEEPNGLSYMEVVRRASEIVESDAKNKEKTVGNVLSALARKGRVHRDGGVYRLLRGAATSGNSPTANG
jgi:hypothetical protein